MAGRRVADPKDGGVRPIAVGDTVDAAARASSALEYLLPLQNDVGVPSAAAPVELMVVPSSSMIPELHGSVQTICFVRRRASGGGQIL